MYRIPAWLLHPLAWLGLVFVFVKPLGLTEDWPSYGVALVFAALFSLYVARRYHSVMLWRGKYSAVVWVRWAKRLPNEPEEMPPIMVASTEPTGPAVKTPEERFRELREHGLMTDEEYERFRQPQSPGQAERPIERATKVCPDCAETVQGAARVCRYCHYRFDDVP